MNRSSHAKKPPAGRNGFTLLELLLAMALVVMIAGMLAVSFHTAFASQEASEKAVEGARTAELVMDWVRNDLQSTLPPSTTSGAFAGTFQGQISDDSLGDADLVFFSTAPSPFHPEGGNGDIKKVELTAYQPDPNKQEFILVRRTWNNLANPPTTTFDEEVLCRNVQGFVLSYYDGTEWMPTWDSTTSTPLNSLPAAVQITLTVGTSEKLPDGSPKLITYTRIFQFPCYVQSTTGTQAGSTTSSGASTTGGGK